MPSNKGVIQSVCLDFNQRRTYYVSKFCHSIILKVETQSHYKIRFQNVECKCFFDETFYGSSSTGTSYKENAERF